MKIKLLTQFMSYTDLKDPNSSGVCKENCAINNVINVPRIKINFVSIILTNFYTNMASEKGIVITDKISARYLILRRVCTPFPIAKIDQSTMDDSKLKNYLIIRRLLRLLL